MEPKEYNMHERTSANTKNWAALLIKGILSTVVGIWIFGIPLESFASLSLLFSLFILANGIFEIVFSFSRKKAREGYGWYLTGGIFDFLMGMLLIVDTEMTMANLTYFLGCWFWFRGIIGIGTSLRLSSGEEKGKDWLLTTALLIFVFSFWVLMSPFLFLYNYGIVYISALAFIALGLFNILMARKLSHIRKQKKHASFQNNIKINADPKGPKWRFGKKGTIFTEPFKTNFPNRLLDPEDSHG